MQRVLVTGAGGYIGSVLVPKLLAKGYAVRAVDRFFFGRENLGQQDNLEIIREDCRRLSPEMFTDIDFVIDLVAISNDPTGELFQQQTWQINHESRVRSAEFAREKGAKRYVLPSTCSIYGFQKELVSEESPINPLTTYARANRKAEEGVLPLADETFCVTVMRQSTVFGVSPRMRFDLAINGMTYGAWNTGKLPLMRDGSQYRPMVHVQDTTDVMCLLLSVPSEKTSGQIFNVGSAENNHQIGSLGKTIATVVGDRLGKPVDIEWYGDPDERSYRVDFTKIEKTLGWQAQWNARQGCSEIVDALQAGLEKTDRTITLNWYKQLTHWHRIIRETEMYSGILEID